MALSPEQLSPPSREQRVRRISRSQDDGPSPDLHLSNGHLPGLLSSGAATSSASSETSAAPPLYTLEPYERPPRRHRNRQSGGSPVAPASKRKRTVQLLPDALVPTVPHTKYYTIKSSTDANLRGLNIFKVDAELRAHLHGDPVSISDSPDGSITVEVRSADQGSLLLSLPSLVGESVTVGPHQRFNEVQGVVICDRLRGYSDEVVLAGLSAQGVTRVRRMLKRINGELTPTNAFILTFHGTSLPDRIRIRSGQLERVRPYVPLPRRCFNCQRFGHLGRACRSQTATCASCGRTAHGKDACATPAHCVNCSGAHPATDRSCPRYLLEKEILSLKTRDKLSFKDARERAMQLFLRPGITYASVLKAPLAATNSARIASASTSNTLSHPEVPVVFGRPPQQRERTERRNDHDRKFTFRRWDVRHDVHAGDTQRASAAAGSAASDTSTATSTFAVAADATSAVSADAAATSTVGAGGTAVVNSHAAVSLADPLHTQTSSVSVASSLPPPSPLPSSTSCHPPPPSPTPPVKPSRASSPATPPILRPQVHSPPSHLGLTQTTSSGSLSQGRRVSPSVDTPLRRVDGDVGACRLDVTFDTDTEEDVPLAASSTPCGRPPISPPPSIHSIENKEKPKFVKLSSLGRGSSRSPAGGGGPSSQKQPKSANPSHNRGSAGPKQTKKFKSWRT